MNQSTILAAKQGRWNRGSVLVTTLISLSLVMVVGGGVLSLTVHGLGLTKRVKKSTVAFNLAESGTDHVTRWLKDQSAPPTGTAAFDPLGGVQSLNGGTYQVTMDPDDANPGAILKKYKVTSIGTFAGQTEKIELILRQSSFGKYAYFTDSETSSITGGRIWFYSGDRVRGPAHSNNAGGSDFQINWKEDGTTIFDGMVTGAGDDINYSPSDPDTEAEFTSIFGNGSLGYQLGVDNVPMPGSTDAQKVAAWGGTSGFPSGTSVSVRTGGGTYISGNSTIAMSVDASGNQVFTITQGTTTTTITHEVGANRRKVQVGSGSPSYVSGLGNGVVYSSGHINSLKGTIGDNKVTGNTITNKNAFTIATDVNAGKDIIVTDTLKYKSPPDPSKPNNDPVNLKPGTLGLMAKNVKVGSSAPQNMQIDAVIMAGSSTTTGGSFYVENYNSKTPTGTLKVTGGIIQKSRGPVGTLNGSGLLSTGYQKDYWYDPRLADNPPPFFPTTGSYDRLSWRRLVQ